MKKKNYNGNFIFQTARKDANSTNEIKSYLKEETCEIFSDFFNEQGMEIQNCFTIVKFIYFTIVTYK